VDEAVAGLEVVLDDVAQVRERRLERDRRLLEARAVRRHARLDEVVDEVR
jgi:hypothetical protein